MKLPILVSLALAATFLITTTSHARPDPHVNLKWHSIFQTHMKNLSTFHARPNQNLNPIKLISERPNTQTLVKHLGDWDDDLEDIVNCQAWFWGSETNNIMYWETIPEWCVDFVKDYMNGQYKKDVQTLFIVMSTYIIDYEKYDRNYEKDVVVFDLMDTLLSTLPYYSLPEVNYGASQFNWTKFSEWITTAEIPPVQYMDIFYQLLVKNDYKMVIITGLEESFKSIIEANLARLGIDNWFKLAFKPQDMSTEEFKAEVRASLVADGYIILANIGDQWRGLTGSNVGNRVFKVPNPMYYLD